jgi:OmpA-OmpF porin, OOP family
MLSGKNMKKTFAIAILAAGFAAPFAAHAQGAYIGLNVGQATHKVDDTAGVTTVSRDQTQTAYKVYGGYNFNKYFGVEGGYADFGSSKNVYRVSGTNVTLNYKAQAVYAAAVGNLPLNDQFSLFGKLGVTNNHASANASAGGVTARVSGNKSSALIGVGAAYNVTKNVAVALEYEDYGKTAEDAKANMWSLGVRYHF